MMNPLPHFMNKLLSSAHTDKERARLLGTSPRTITEYKSGKYPRILLKIVLNLDLAEALAADARALAATGKNTTPSAEASDD